MFRNSTTHRTPGPRPITLKPTTAAAAVALAAGACCTASAQNDPPGITFVQVVDHVDKDGDGYSRSIRFQVRGNTMMNEKGKEVKPLQNKGNPLYTVEMASAGLELIQPIEDLKRNLTLASKRIPRDEDAVNYLTVEWSDLKSTYDELDPSQSDDEEQARKGKAALESILDGAAMRGFDVGLYEDDEQPRYTPFQIFVTGDVTVDTYSFDADRTFRLESPEDDETRTFYVNTSPWGATLTINGEAKGTTPWGEQVPIDYADRVAETTTIRVEKEGYEIKTVERKIEPPHVVEIELDKKYAMGTIRPEPGSARVYVNGELVGNGTSGRQYWVQEELDIVVEAEGHKTQRLMDLRAPFDKTVELELTEAARERLSEQRETVEDARKGGLPGQGENLETELGIERLRDGATGEIDLPGGGEQETRSRQDADAPGTVAPPVDGITPTPDLEPAGDDHDTSAQAVDMTGRWDSQFGTLHLWQVGSHVVGDYNGNGVILGKVDGRCLAGVFTNGARNGVFRFDIDESGESFDGEWDWRGAVPGNSWDGSLADDASSNIADLEGADYAGFTPGSDGIASRGEAPPDVRGVYKSPLGMMELVARDGFIIGDLGGAEVLAGVWDGDSYVGKFTAGEKAGWFDVRFDPADGSFQEGAYAWIDGAPERFPGSSWAPDGESIPESGWRPDRVPGSQWELEGGQLPGSRWDDDGEQAGETQRDTQDIAGSEWVPGSGWVPGNSWTPELVPGPMWQPRRTPAEALMLESAEGEAEIDNVRKRVDCQ